MSFEAYREGEPWVAYGQFCQRFLASLALMSTTDVRLNQLFRVYIYAQRAFDRAFGRRFDIEERVTIGDSERTLYLMEKRGN